jgi:hypothetical protein
MKECSIDFERAVVTDYQAPEVSEPADCAFNDPAFSVSVQRAAILRGRANAIFLVGVLRAEGKLLHPGVREACALGSCEGGPVRTLPVDVITRSASRRVE